MGNPRWRHKPAIKYRGTTMSWSRHPHSQRGLSLIELMISMTLGIILSFGAIQIYLSSKQTYNTQDSLSRMQENARFALDLIVRDIRGAGYIGCGNLDSVSPTIVTAGLPSYDLATAFTGHQAIASNWTPSLPGSLVSSLAHLPTVSAVATGMDVLTVSGAGRCSTPLTVDMTGVDGNVQIAAANNCGFSNGGVVLVSDCSQADLFRISTTPSAGALTHADDLTGLYLISSATSVMSFTSASYFIARDTATLIPSLYMLDNTQAPSSTNPIALVEGVTSIQVLYGIDDDDDNVPNQYSTADAVTDWGQVITARVSLLMRTIGAVQAGNQTFTFEGISTTFTDDIMRKEYTATVQLRNRGL